jgi:hypothetical protein
MKNQIPPTHFVEKALGLLVVAVAWPLAVALADSPTWTTIDVPGAGKTAAFGLNGSGIVVGDYSALSGPQAHGFSWTAGVFTLIDVQGAKSTRPLGINDASDIVGYWQDNKSGRTHGFLLRGNGYTLFDTSRWMAASTATCAPAGNDPAPGTRSRVDGAEPEKLERQPLRCPTKQG